MPMQENEIDTTNQALGTTVMVPGDEDSLSTHIIMDYFTSDGPRGRRLAHTSYNELDRNENSEDKILQHFGAIASQTFEERAMETDSAKDKTTNHQVVRSASMIEEMRTRKIAPMALAVLVLILALAHCMWMLNVVELSALSLEFDV
ncbi:hypothetical protein KXD40_002548 [Peronospora effusa]|uniref:Uncharacterized protein n=1 Tax=Peronospora effusa TaxID=542832 RepID=A0A3M6V9Z1_9STRA|nr:hypothetical protein DD238_007106 [Peronospora effusa]RQM17971.1 hypothetical protein DD237_001325 [Peronospora effusa]UIZ26872.1 hypothetical protein KXD40_002548 [Peronospora effusa]CAI5703887.1 unnamed protein product [Peronospora effusa]